MKKHILSFLFITFVLLYNASMAQVLVSPAHGGTGVCVNNAQNRTPPYGIPVTLDTIMIRETSHGDFSAGIDSVRLQVPPSWNIWDAVPYLGDVNTSLGTEIDSLTIIYDNNHITLYIRATHTSVLDTIFLTGFAIVPLYDTAHNGYLYAQSVSGMAGITTGATGTNFGRFSLSPQPIIAPYMVMFGTSPVAIDSTAGGTWSSTDTTVATINPVTGVITTVSDGLDTLIYSVAGCSVKHGIRVFREGAVPQVSTTSGDIQLYPNPARTTLTIQSRTPITTLTITNLLGQTMYTGSQPASREEIDVSAYPSGIYFLHINGAEVRKWVKE